MADTTTPPSAATRPIVADSVTRLGPEAEGAVLVAASHGGIYAAYLAAVSKVRGVILNDAGLGLDRAGIGGLDLAQKIGLAAATVSHNSARIGDGRDMITRGRISHANVAAIAAGVEPGQSCAEAAERLAAATMPFDRPAPYAEARRELNPRGPLGPRIVLIDSAALVKAEDAGQVVITGSHGGLIGGDTWNALKTDAFAAAYNDAGIGIDEAGTTRLPALDARAIAGFVVDCTTARIGEAASTYEDGLVSRVNRRAYALGLREGQSAREAVEILMDAMEGRIERG